ncbi:MAG TPA: fasciclin domain-containing protein [Fulvivirga sp.]|nr:fasciclin domain-containing protein [Fulvivirga sp.]
MKNLNLTTLLGRLLTVVLVGAMLGFMGCSSDDDPTTPAPVLNLYETMLLNNDLTIFKAYIENDAELKAILQGSTDYTLFAPNDEAFDRLQSILGLDDLSQISEATIAQVLRFHFVAGTHTKAELTSLGAIKTLQGDDMHFNSDGTIFDGGSNKEAVIIDADIATTNGNIQAVGTILIPPSIFDVVEQTLGTLAQPILLGSDFTYLYHMLLIADSDVPSGQTPITSMLADNKSGKQYTFFAQANAVIDGAIALNPNMESVDDYYAAFTPNAAAARTYFLNHLIVSETTAYTEANLEEGPYTMASGLVVNVSNTETPSEQLPTGWVIVSENTIQSPIYQFDVAANVGGVMHVSAPIY